MRLLSEAEQPIEDWLAERAGRNGVPVAGTNLRLVTGTKLGPSGLPELRSGQVSRVATSEGAKLRALVFRTIARTTFWLPSYGRA